MTVPPAEALGTELERLALYALAGEYSHLNATLFDRTLRQPVLMFTDSQSRFGRWVSADSTIEIARRLLTDTSWGVLVEVLKHEMAHQYVDQVLGLGDEGPHGAAFRRVCQERAIDFRASGMPSSTSAVAGGEARIVERIAKLLALAKSSNVHEAEVAMATAQRLMLKYNVELVAHGASARYGFRHLGEPTGRLTESRRMLAAILRDHFFVEVLWVGVWRPVAGKRGTVLEVCGTAENVEMAAYVHSFLVHTAEQLWRAFKRERGLTGGTAHRTFLAGVMSGFHDKLNSERARQQKEGLVWAGDPELTRYLKQRHPRVRMARRLMPLLTSEFLHGRKAGRSIVLHRGVERGPTAAPRLLEAASPVDGRPVPDSTSRD
jgi:hypothetical protein